MKEIPLEELTFIINLMNINKKIFSSLEKLINLSFYFFSCNKFY